MKLAVELYVGMKYLVPAGYELYFILLPSEGCFCAVLAHNLEKFSQVNKFLPYYLIVKYTCKSTFFVAIKVMVIILSS